MYAGTRGSIRLPSAHHLQRTRPKKSAQSRRLDGQTQRNWWLWRRLARRPEAGARLPVGRPLPGSAEPARASRRALRRRGSRPRALPSGAL
eukprot:scaffold3505_cov60-Phaeocystis_antarctica.AAC.1